MKKYILAAIASLFATGFILASAFAQDEIAPTAPWYQALVSLPKGFHFQSSPKIALTNSKSGSKGSFGAHIMPIRLNGAYRSQTQFAASPKILLSYYGGPVLSHVKVVVVYWDKNVAFQDQIPGFFANITQSPFFDWLKEYRTPSQSVQRGSLEAMHVSKKAPFKNLIEDSEIQSQLTRMIKAGSVPHADKDTLYMIYFPPQMQIDLAGQKSCEVFCAYHNSFLKNGEEINYGVIPDQGGACAGGCGNNSSQFNNETSVSSHELTEAVTDPAVGLVKGSEPAYPLGWYNASAGEIGDICADKQGTVEGYVVQKEWSNSRQTCVSSASDPGSPVASPN